uniref:Uncharacterized protein n=1 Tax=Anguilla anguilla TaxID=7936 RepID=A0A0E9Q014_ANGAN
MSPKSIQCSLLRLKRCLFEKLKRRGRKGEPRASNLFLVVAQVFPNVGRGRGSLKKAST